MVFQVPQLMCVMLAFVGWMGTIIACGLPVWRVSTFTGSNIVTAQVAWEGLWMSCVVPSTGQKQCKVHDSVLALRQDLQAYCLMVITSVLLGLLGVLMAIIGRHCTNSDRAAKAKVSIVSGVIFIIAGLLIMIPVSWSAQSVIRDFYNSLGHEAQTMEIGASLYIGWGSAVLLLLGGGLLCSNCPSTDGRPHTPTMFSSARTTYSNVNNV